MNPRLLFVAMVVGAVSGTGVIKGALPAGALLRFDCGPKSQQAAPGFTTLSGQDTYTPERGYGWLKAWGADWGGNAPKNGVLGSSIGARKHVDVQPEDNDVTFQADLSNGVYAVTVWVGVESPREGRLGICLAANGRAVLPPPGTGGWGVVAERTLPAVVEDGALRLNFYVVGQGGAARLSILGFKIEPAATPEQQAALRKNWEECGLKGDKPGQINVGAKTYTEVGRRREVPLGPLPEGLQNQALLVFSRANPGDLLNYSIPRREELRQRLSAFAAPDEDQPVWFGVHALRPLQGVRVICSDLDGPAGRLPAGLVQIFTMTTRPRSMADRPGSMITLTSDLLDPNAPFDVTEGRTQPIYLRIHVPTGTVAGLYTGIVTIAPQGSGPVRLPLTLRVLPISLQSPRDKVWHLFSDSLRWVRMTPPEWRSEIEDMARHGVNSLLVGYPPYGASYIERDGRIVDADYGITGEILRYSAELGMTGPAIIGATPGIFWRCRGWRIDHTGAATNEFVAGQSGRALFLKHTAVAARTAVGQRTGVLLVPGESVRLAMRYRTEGVGAAAASLTFMKTHKSGAVEEGKIVGTLTPAADWQTFSAVTRVPPDAPYGSVSLSFTGGAGALCIDEVSLMREGHAVNPIVNPGFERDVDVPAEDAVEWPESFMREFIDAIKALGRAVERAGLHPWIEGTDEANGKPRELNEMRGARASGLPTFCNLNPSAVEKMGKDLDAVCLYSAFLGTEQDCRNLLTAYHKRRQKLFVIASGTYVGQEFDWMPNRHHVGLCFWKSDADGAGLWTFQRPNGDPFDDLDAGTKDYCMVFPPRTPGGPPVPTLGWEGIREGWRDFRYVHTLEQAVTQAEKSGRTEAVRMGRAVLAFIRDTVPWFDQAGGSTGYDNTAADQLRWLAAWATMDIQSGKAPAPSSVTPAGVKALAVTFNAASSVPPNAPLLCPVAAVAPAVDGRLDDLSWAAATRMDGFRNYMTGEPARMRTEVLFCHDTTNLYVGFRCFESSVQQIKAAVTNRDGHVFADDSVELFIDTRNDEFNFFHLALNAAGTCFDQRAAGDNNAGANVFGANYANQKVRDTAWNGEWTAKTSRHADRWEAEVVVPFKTFGRESDLWGLNVCRNRKAADAETSAWRTYGMFQQPKKFGKMLLAGARSGPSALTQIDAPMNRYGLNTADVRLSESRGLRGRAEVLTRTGKSHRFSGDAVDGGFRLPYRLDESATALTIVIEADGREQHRIRMPVDVPAPITVTRTQRILATDAPRGTLHLALQVSGQELAERRFDVSLFSPGGGTVDHVETPLSGDACTVAMDLTDFPQGMYTLALTLTGPKGSAAIERREVVVLVPPFLEGRE